MELNKNMINHRGIEKMKDIFHISKRWKRFGEKSVKTFLEHWDGQGVPLKFS